jgi:hypothetical protein
MSKQRCYEDTFQTPLNEGGRGVEWKAKERSHCLTFQLSHTTPVTTQHCQKKKEERPTDLIAKGRCWSAELSDLPKPPGEHTSVFEEGHVEGSAALEISHGPRPATAATSASTTATGTTGTAETKQRHGFVLLPFDGFCGGALVREVKPLSPLYFCCCCWQRWPTK